MTRAEDVAVAVVEKLESALSELSRAVGAMLAKRERLRTLVEQWAIEGDYVNSDGSVTSEPIDVLGNIIVRMNEFAQELSEQRSANVGLAKACGDLIDAGSERSRELEEVCRRERETRLELEVKLELAEQTIQRRDDEIERLSRK